MAVFLASWLAAASAQRWPRWRRPWIYAGVSIMAAHLCFWKYAPSVVAAIQRACPAFWGGAKLALPLPLGISFFTLQGIAYLVDYERGDAKFMSLREYILFKSFFAQLIAGPITRARELLPQLEHLTRPSEADLADGLALFSLGLLKKLVIADRMDLVADAVFSSPGQFGRAALLAGLVGYAVQIWADFSGYTDMGRGCARMLGIRLPENFLSPYLARSPSEFWRRWHITLSEWIRDYIYKPLGGGRGGPARALGVLVLTMAVSGLWHGSSLTFLLWGLYHAGLLAVERV
ncbi:MAG: MBOAT family protein [Elusimicrobia bacterium]|nr:MBOAT family protein [Elusimicrobiota bacterium]